MQISTNQTGAAEGIHEERQRRPARKRPMRYVVAPEAMRQVASHQVLLGNNLASVYHVHKGYLLETKNYLKNCKYNHLVMKQ
ncbi:hypothetical protein FKM82_011019 [Ascaphus truei]